MSKTSKWIASIGAVILGLALITFVGAWRLDLLPLFFPSPAPAGTAQNITTETGLPPAGAYKQQQQPSETGAETDADNTDQQQKSLSAPGITTMNGLVSEAFSEFQSDQKQGNDAAAATLAFKYMSEGSALEKQCDAQFYSLLDEYEADLRKNNLPLDTAIKAKQEYESAKVNRQKEIISAAAKML